MEIKVRLFAGYREAVGAKVVTLEVPEGSTLGDVWNTLAAEHERLRPFTPGVVGAINAEYRALPSVLSPGDEVAFLPPVAGGDHFGVTEQPIDEAALRRAVADPGAGAILVFTGTTRNQTGGRQVEFLEYEAFPEMAERYMAAIAAEIRERWSDVRGVAIVHRVAA